MEHMNMNDLTVEQYEQHELTPMDIDHFETDPVGIGTVGINTINNYLPSPEPMEGVVRSLDDDPPNQHLVAPRLAPYLNKKPEKFRRPCNLPNPFDLARKRCRHLPGSSSSSASNLNRNSGNQWYPYQFPYKRPYKLRRQSPLRWLPSTKVSIATPSALSGIPRSVPSPIAMAYNLQPVNNPRKRAFVEDDDTDQPDTRRRDCADIDPMDISQPDPQVDKEEPPAPIACMPGSWPTDPLFPPDREIEKDVTSGTLSWNGNWIPHHRVITMCKKVYRGVRGMRQTVINTVQAAAEIAGSVKRRALGIETRQQSPVRSRYDSRTRVVPNHRQTLTQVSPARHQIYANQWQREELNTLPSPPASPSERLDTVAEASNSPPLPRSPAVILSPAVAPSPHRRQMSGRPFIPKSSPRQVSPSAQPQGILHRTQNGRITKSAHLKTPVPKLYINQYVKGVWMPNDGYVGWLPKRQKSEPYHAPATSNNMSSVDSQPQISHFTAADNIEPASSGHATDAAYLTSNTSSLTDRVARFPTVHASATETGLPRTPQETTDHAEPSSSRHTCDLEHNTSLSDSTDRVDAPADADRFFTNHETIINHTASSDSAAYAENIINASGDGVEPVELIPPLAPWLRGPRPVPTPESATSTSTEENRAVAPTPTNTEGELEETIRLLSTTQVTEATPHRPLSVRWLDNDTPLGRPVSSVRLFNPHSPIHPPPERNVALCDAEWRQEEQKRNQQARATRRSCLKSGPAVRPLSAEWEDRVANAMLAPDSRQLATTLSGDSISRRDLNSCHSFMKWLNDEIINAYLAHLVSYLRRTNGNNGRHDRPRYHAFNSFFFSNIRDKGYGSVHRWASRAKIGGEALLDVDTVFIPVHNNDHWTLMVVRPAARTIEYFDSLGSPSPTHVDAIKVWLRGELNTHYIENEWTVLPTASPQQDNGSDCGVFLLTTAKAVALNLEPSVYGPADIRTLRKKIVAELMNGGLEGEFDPAGESGESRL